MHGTNIGEETSLAKKFGPFNEPGGPSLQDTPLEPPSRPAKRPPGNYRDEGPAAASALQVQGFGRALR